jgi:hypothetical protein
MDWVPMRPITAGNIDVGQCGDDTCGALVREAGQGRHDADFHADVPARNGVDRCVCGCKYWENGKCIDCGTPVTKEWVNR